MKKSEEMSHGILKKWSSAIYSIMDRTIGLILTSCLELLAFLARTTVVNLLLLILLCMGFLIRPPRGKERTFTSSIKIRARQVSKWLSKQTIKSIKYAGILISLVRPSKESPSLVPLGILTFIISAPIVLAMVTL